MPEDDGLACRGMVFADGEPIGMVDGTVGVTFEPDDGEGTWRFPLPFPELSASVELTTACAPDRSPAGCRAPTPLACGTSADARLEA